MHESGIVYSEDLRLLINVWKDDVEYKKEIIERLSDENEDGKWNARISRLDGEIGGILNCIYDLKSYL